MGKTVWSTCSIVLSGGYEDDIDNLIIFYTQAKWKDTNTGNQIKDQDFVRNNRALQVSFENKYPIRVSRGYQIKHGPQSGYRYDGLYLISNIERVRGVRNFFVCRFHLHSQLLRKELQIKIFNINKANKQVSEIQSLSNKLSRITKKIKSDTIKCQSAKI